MNSATLMVLDFDGVTSRRRKITFIKRAISFIKSRRIPNRPKGNVINRDRTGSHQRLVAAVFSEEPMYDLVKFRKTFRMGRPLFNQIVVVVIDHDPYFRDNMDCTGRMGVSGLLKCTLAIRQLAYDVNADFLDEYMQMSERNVREARDRFCEAIIKIYGREYLRKPIATDVEKLYRHHEQKHGFPGMLGSLDCTDWEWFGCQYQFKAQYVRRDHGLNPFILLEAVASQDLWIWHAFFGVAGSNNDINVLHQSPLFNDLKTGRTPEIPFEANGVTYPSGYYLLTGYTQNWPRSLRRFQNQQEKMSNECLVF